MHLWLYKNPLSLLWVVCCGASWTSQGKKKKTFSYLWKNKNKNRSMTKATMIKSSTTMKKRRKDNGRMVKFFHFMSLYRFTTLQRSIILHQLNDTRAFHYGFIFYLTFLRGCALKPTCWQLWFVFCGRSSCFGVTRYLCTRISGRRRSRVPERRQTVPVCLRPGCGRKPRRSRTECPCPRTRPSCNRSAGSKAELRHL